MSSSKPGFFLTVLPAFGMGIVLLSSGPARSLTPQGDSSSQKRSSNAKPVTIPVSILIRGSKAEPELQTIYFAVSEDGEPQGILSVRSIYTNSPITMALLIQDDLVSSIANEIKPITEFIRHLPKGSHVMVGYIRSGSLQVRQKFTNDLDKAANALRVPLGLSSASPFNPYVEVLEALARFESQPGGRRAMLVVSDGLDVSRGVDAATTTHSLDLERAIKRAQQRSVAIYSFYVPSVSLAASNNQTLIGYAQSSLQRLSSETGGRAFFQGSSAPVSLEPFLRDLNASLERQIALTYLSTHNNKGFHRLHIRSSLPGVEVSYPAGYSK